MLSQTKHVSQACGLKHSNCSLFFIFVPHDATSPSEPRLAHYRGFMIILRHTTFARTPLDEWSTSHRYLYLTTHNTQPQIYIHDTGGIRTRNPSKRAAADPTSWTAWPLGSVSNCYIQAQNRYERLFRLLKSDKLYVMNHRNLMHKNIIELFHSCSCCGQCLYTSVLNWQVCFFLQSLLRSFNQYVYKPTRFTKFLWLDFIFH
jgi:hypothetical protein